jgi:hypothetical protein
VCSSAAVATRPSHQLCPRPLAAHESERTTKLYDRRDDKVTLDEIERINYRVRD